MQITFQTKEESNKNQLEDFLKLSKSERIYSFISFMMKSKQIPKKELIQKSTNFLIEIKSKS
jgi:hypothetical protein